MSAPPYEGICFHLDLRTTLDYVLQRKEVCDSVWRGFTADQTGIRQELTSPLSAVAGGQDGSAACQQLDRKGLDPSYQRHRHPWTFDRHDPRDRRHAATVLEQPEEREQEKMCEGGKDGNQNGGGNKEERSQIDTTFKHSLSVMTSTFSSKRAVMMPNRKEIGSHKKMVSMEHNPGCN